MTGRESLATMSLNELMTELRAAGDAVMAAEYQEGLASYTAVRDAARARKRAVEAEIDRRHDLLLEEEEAKLDGE
jgi:hypothetical protein